MCLLGKRRQLLNEESAAAVAISGRICKTLQNEKSRHIWSGELAESYAGDLALFTIDSNQYHDVDISYVVQRRAIKVVALDRGFAKTWPRKISDEVVCA